MLIIQPVSCLQDETVEIRAVNLKPNKKMTVSCHLEDARKHKYFSYAHFFTNYKGQISTNISASCGGSYIGRFPMGLIACLAQAPNESGHLRLFKKHVEKPNKLEFRLYDDHVEPDELFDQKIAPLQTKHHYRHYMAEGVTRLPIREGRVRGTIFIPKGPGPFPGVVDVFGTTGGLLEYRSAMLASRGILSFAIAYFGYDDLPNMLESIDIDYFQEAVHILLKHPKVIKPNVGAIGISKGGDLVLSMGTYIPEVKAVVNINGSCSNTTVPLKRGDQVLRSALEWDNSRAKFDNGTALLITVTDDALQFPNTIIPVEEADANFLHLVSLNDENVQTSYLVDISVDRLKKAGKNNFKICNYPGAGHLVDPPYSALCYDSYHKLIGIPVAYGGTGRAHCEAQVAAWRETLSFLEENLSKPESKL